MFVFSVSTKKKKKNFFIIFVGIVLLLGAALSGFWVSNHRQNISSSVYFLSAENQNDIQKFAGQFHIKIGNQPETVQKIRIPLKFNDIYSNYNALQQHIGLNLEPYKGKYCIIYTYKIQNTDCLFHVLVANHRVIAADISEEGYNGFIGSPNDTSFLKISK